MNRSSKVILAGFAAAVLLWYIAGILYSIAYGWDSIFISNSLFYYQLLPGLILIFVICCMTVSAIKINAGALSCNSPRNRKLITITCLIALAIVHGTIIQSKTHKFESSLPAIEKAVDQNLVQISSLDAGWTPEFSLFPKFGLIGARRGNYLAGARVKVELTSKAKLRSAYLYILDSIGWDNSSPKDIIPHLKNYKVNELMFHNLHGDKGTWKSKRKEYSLYITDY